MNEWIFELKEDSEARNVTGWTEQFDDGQEIENNERKTIE